MFCLQDRNVRQLKLSPFLVGVGCSARDDDNKSVDIILSKPLSDRSHRVCAVQRTARRTSYDPSEHRDKTGN